MEEFNKNIEKYLPFLEDLRRRFLIGVILFAVSFLVGLLCANIFFGEILGLIDINDVVIVASSPFQFIYIAMNFGFAIAILVTVPYVILSAYLFVLPALTKNEKRELLKSVPVSVFLFVLGLFYGFFVLYYALEALASLNTSLGIANFWNISQLLSQMLFSSVLLGLLFEFPLLLTLLIKFGVITPATLRDNRRIAYGLLLFLVVLLPPTDILSLVGMVMPLLFLYEATVVLNAVKYGAVAKISPVDISIDPQ